MGITLILAFADGVIRTICIDVNGKLNKNSHVVLVQATKPHTAPITALSINFLETIIISGSEDRTVFLYHIRVIGDLVQLEPIGLVNTLAVPTAFNWNPINVKISYKDVLYN